MGRAPCCDKANVKKGPWSPEEDAKLKAYIEQHGTGGNWIALPQKIGLKRCGKSCRLRWLNYLRPNIKHGGFSEEEDNIICSLYVSIGSRWSIIAAQLPGRTDNDIKNYWNTRLKKKLLGKQRKEQQAQARRVSCLKQAEMKKECENLMVPPITIPAGVTNQTSYWPSEISEPIPVPTSSVQDYNLHNQASLRSLLTELGGRFSDQHQPPYSTLNSQYPCEISFPQDQVYPTFMNMLNPASAAMVTTSNNSNTCQSPILFQGFENFPNDHDLIELVSVNQQQTDAMQGYYGMESMEMGNGSTGTSSTESTSWGDLSMSSLVYSPLVSDHQYEGMPHPRDVGFQESRYFGMQ
ncbi:hypothetical protein L6164_019782 [Bauhinia variegata]|uniref:Uncharacterized protein n=1 Tax=Bauhinia variegata TaxID=167791 RepID=A0ACB9MXN6_BAUVA|nr:hypothetical protein L6164_019782 [Bauhinia variegata]